MEIENEGPVNRGRELAFDFSPDAPHLSGPTDKPGAQEPPPSSPISVAQLNHDLLIERARRIEAERINHLKDDFLANLSHELRTPVNAILGWAELLRPGTATPHELSDGLDAIRRNARTQSRLIEDLLDTTRIAAGKLRLDIKPLDLPDVISAAIDVIRPAATLKGLDIHVSIAPNIGPVAGDPDRVQQILWNLLSNAVKFSHPGGSITVAVSRVDSYVRFAVADTGAGIDADFLPHIFDRHTQGERLYSRQHHGLGLGLAIVRQLVELHGGVVRAESNGASQGSTFYFSLPISAAPSVLADQDRQHLRDHLTAAQHPHLDLAGLVIMVVNDEADGLALVKSILQRANATVYTCSTGTECLARLPSLRPNLLISDIGMPDFDGYALIRAIRALPEDQGGLTPAIALTAHARSIDRRNALLGGFNMHVSLPIEPAELQAVASRTAR